MKKDLNIINYKLKIDDKDIINSKFIKGPTNSKFISFFDLPIEITDCFFMEYGNILNKNEYTINLRSDDVDDRIKIENIICDLYFNIFKIAATSNKYQEIPTYAEKAIIEVQKDMFECDMLNKHNIIKFEWDSSGIKNNIPQILKKLISISIELRELHRKLIKERLINLLEANRLNPYF